MLTLTSLARSGSSLRTLCVRYYSSQETLTLWDAYKAKVADGSLTTDPKQEEIVLQLDQLNSTLTTYKPEKNTPSRWSRLMQSGKSVAKSIPKGIYVYGSVGTGKTMLMDMFYTTCQMENKNRMHFHEFMQDVHQRLHEMKKKMPRDKKPGGRKLYDPITPVANDIAASSWLLCFDEFQVTDIADAMILKRLFSGLWDNGVVVVATSNRPPKDLYKNGLQRINFIPFIGMIEEKCDIVSLDSSIDYRRRDAVKAADRFFVKSQCDADSEMDRVFKKLVDVEHKETGPITLTVLSRQVHFKKACGKVLDCHFDELCSRALGAADYLRICETFDIILIRDIPILSLNKRSEVRRFVNLVDTLYDHLVGVVCSAEAEPDELFLKQNSLSEEDVFQARVLKADLDIKKGDNNEAASIFTGEEEIFAFDRVISRLMEMQTDGYWKELKKRKSKTRKPKN